MKKFTRLLALSLLIVMAVSMLVSCGSTYGKIEKNLGEINYLPVEEANETAKKIANELAVEDEDGNKTTVTAHVFKKDAGILPSYAIVLEFTSEADIEAAIAESETLKGLVKDSQKSDYINGNCLLVPLTLTDSDALIEAFKK